VGDYAGVVPGSPSRHREKHLYSLLSIEQPPFKSCKLQKFLSLRTGIESLTMKILIEIYREGRFFLARDLLTKIADQGLTEQEAVQNLKKGVGDHYQLLIEMTPPGHQLKYLDIEVDNLVGNSPAVS
jgi:hypothetical protein